MTSNSTQIKVSFFFFCCQSNQGPHLRIPYRVKDGDFTTDQHNVIKESLDEMSGYLNGCIEFYDDTESQDKSFE